jgi:hypothetical protein
MKRIPGLVQPDTAVLLVQHRVPASIRLFARYHVGGQMCGYGTRTELGVEIFAANALPDLVRRKMRSVGVLTVQKCRSYPDLVGDFD